MSASETSSLGPETNSASNHEPRSSLHAEIAAGVKDFWPVAIGFLPLGVAFGLLVVQTGFVWWWAPIFSVVIYAGSVEFLALSMMTGGIGPVAAAVTGFMVNFRHVFYGLTFPLHRVRSWLGRAYSTYALTDEAYAIVSSMPKEEAESLSTARILTIQAGCQVLWVGSGIVGALAGNVVPAGLQGMEFALVALFIVLAVDSFRNNPDFSLPVSAGLLALGAVLVLPEHMLMVALCSYFLLLFLRHLSPRFDDALLWRARSGSEEVRNA